MPRNVATALSVLLLASVPLVLIGNALWLLLNPWLVDAQYALPGFPNDREGVQDPLRTELAKTGVESIRPGGDGIAPLEEERLDNGRAAFARKEIRHMADVRDLVAGVLTAWGIALACAVVAGLALVRFGERESVRRGLTRGARLTIVAMTLLGVAMAVDFETFFDAFHGVFFEGDSWRFDERFTLRQLYPDAFWGIAGATMAALVLFQAVAVLLITRAKSGR
jgi:integral membrane protein (TIGR01906 family)